MKPDRGRDGAEIAAPLSSFRTDRDRAIAGLMLLSRLRNAEVPGLRSPTWMSGRAGCG